MFCFPHHYSINSLPPQRKTSASRLESAIKRLPREKKLALIADDTKLPGLLPRLNAEDYTRLPGVTLEDCLKGELP